MKRAIRCAAPALCSLLLLPWGPAPARAEDDAPALVLTDVTQAAGLAEVGGDRFSFGDYDGDGDADLLVGGSRLLRNDTVRKPGAPAALRFTDVTEASGIAQGPGGGACWVDVDGDGDLDVVTQGGALKLQVAPGRFEDRASAWGLPTDAKASTVGVGDVDGDRRPDVLFGGGEDWNDGNAVFHPRRLYRNVDGKRFEAVECAALATPRYGRAVVFADYDRDGDQDVYLGNYRLQPNELLLNEGGTLTDVAEARGVQGRHDPKAFHDDKVDQDFGWQWGHTIASSWADLDGDGDLDLWVSNLVHKFVGETQMQGRTIYDIRGYVCDDSAIYRNDGAPGHAFTDVRQASGIPVRPIGDRGTYRGDELWSNAACADLDADGLPEVFVAQVYKLPYSHALLFRNRGGFRFEEVSGALHLRRFNSYGGAFADLDGDGDPDLVCGGSPTPDGKRGLCVLRNDTEAGPWLAFRLRGRAPDTTALGAQVTVVTDRGAFVRQVEACMGSHAQQNENVLRFGLRGMQVKEAWVRWPGGVIQPLPDLAPGAVREIREAEGAPPAFAIEVPARVTAGKPVTLRARTAGARRAAWIWRYDTGTAIGGEPGFRDAPGGVAEARFEPGPAEVRFRLVDRRTGVAREAVARFEATSE